MRVRESVFEDRHNRESRLCRFFILESVVLLGFFVIVDEFLRDEDLTDEVEVDFDVLHSMPGIILRRLKHLDLLHEFMKRCSVQLRDLAVSADDLQEGVDPCCLLFLLLQEEFDLSKPRLQLGLLGLVSGGHLHVPVITDLAGDVVLVEPLDNGIDLADSGFCLIAFLPVFAHHPAVLRAAALGHQLHEFILMLFGEGEDPFELIQHNPLHDDVSDLVRAARLGGLAVAGAGEVPFAVIPILAAHLIHLSAAVSAVHQSSELSHISEGGAPAPVLPDVLDDAEGFFFDDRFVRILEDLPFGFRVLDLFFCL